MKRTQTFSLISAIALSGLALASCEKEGPEMPYLVPNKWLISLTETQQRDSIFVINSKKYYIDAITIAKYEGREILCEEEAREKETVLKNDTAVFGNIIYDDDEISKIEINNWCTLTRAHDPKLGKLYIVEPHKQITRDKAITIWLKGDKGPTSVTIE